MSFCSGTFQQSFKGFQVAPERHNTAVPFQFNGKEYTLSHGSVVIAAITSCTNTSNPSVMLGAGGWTILLLPWILRSVSWSGWRLIGLYASSSRTPREKGNRVRPECEAVHKDQPVTWQWRGHLLPKGERRHEVPLSAWVSCSDYSFSQLSLCVESSQTWKKTQQKQECEPQMQLAGATC